MFCRVAHPCGAANMGSMIMTLPDISIDSLPLLDTTVGLFGSITEHVISDVPSVFEWVIIFLMIIYD
jgi:hypothetical protein